MTIGEMIYNRRKELNMTLEYVGHAVGVGKSTVRKWETGMIKKISVDNVSALSRVLDIPIERLVSTDGSLTDEEYELIDTYRKLPPELQINLLTHSRLLLAASHQ